MSRIFSIDTEPYEAGDVIFTQPKVELHPGVTTLVGCNGYGKTTFIHQVYRQIPNTAVKIKYDNLTDGGSQAKSKALFHDDITTLATLAFSSEGESININLGTLAGELGNLQRANRDKELWIFLDAIDSGLSIDNVREFKEFIELVAEHSTSDVYWIISANAYEMARGTRCLDVYTGQEVSFQTYDEYAEFVMQSRERKDRRNA